MRLFWFPHSRSIWIKHQHKDLIVLWKGIKLLQLLALLLILKTATMVSGDEVEQLGERILSDTSSETLHTISTFWSDDDRVLRDLHQPNPNTYHYSHHHQHHHHQHYNVGVDFVSRVRSPRHNYQYDSTNQSTNAPQQFLSTTAIHHRQTTRPKQYRILATTTTNPVYASTKTDPFVDATDNVTSASLMEPSTTVIDSAYIIFDYNTTEANDEMFQLNSSSSSTPISTITTMTSMPFSATLLYPYKLRITATIVCVIVLLCGVSGNILVPFVVCRTRELCTNSTNVFLINLSIADLLVLVVCMPTVMIELHSKPEVWTLGEVMCKFSFCFDLEIFSQTKSTSHFHKYKNQKKD